MCTLSDVEKISFESRPRRRVTLPAVRCVAAYGFDAVVLRAQQGQQSILLISVLAAAS